MTMKLSLFDKIHLYKYWKAETGHSLAMQNVLDILGCWDEFEKYVSMRDDFERDIKPDDVCDKDFFSIKGGVITWQGYLYNDGDGWHTILYCDFEMSLEDFIKKYDRDPVKAYEAKGQHCKQYINDYDDVTVEGAVRDWMCSTIPIKTEEITEDMPDGEYFFVDKPWEAENG